MGKAIMLTGTIDSSVFNNTNVVLTDLQQRLKQYKTAIEFYITQTFFDKIIFVENSGYDFEKEKYEILANQHRKQFEFVSIRTDKGKTIRFGKSYGEADCIEQGIKRSVLLSEEQSFYKITGRIILRNANKICNDQDNLTRLIFRCDLKRCYTMFFKMNIEDFWSYFVKAKDLCDETKDIDVESTYYEIANNSGKEIATFKGYPLLEGTIGTTGKSYGDNKLVYLSKCLLSLSGMYSQKGNCMIMNVLAQIRLFFFKKK